MGELPTISFELVATAKTDADQWLMLDPDFGGVILHELSELEKAPNKVLDYYWNDELKKEKGRSCLVPKAITLTMVAQMYNGSECAL